MFKKVFFIFSLLALSLAWEEHHQHDTCIPRTELVVVTRTSVIPVYKDVTSYYDPNFISDYTDFVMQTTTYVKAMQVTVGQEPYIYTHTSYLTLPSYITSTTTVTAVQYDYLSTNLIVTEVKTVDDTITHTDIVAIQVTVTSTFTDIIYTTEDIIGYAPAPVTGYAPLPATQYAPIPAYAPTPDYNAVLAAPLADYAPTPVAHPAEYVPVDDYVPVVPVHDYAPIPVAPVSDYIPAAAPVHDYLPAPAAPVPDYVLAPVDEFINAPSAANARVQDTNTAEEPSSQIFAEETVVSPLIYKANVSDDEDDYELVTEITVFEVQDGDNTTQDELDLFSLPIASISAAQAQSRRAREAQNSYAHIPAAPVVDYAPTPVLPAAPVEGYEPVPVLPLAPVPEYAPAPVIPAAPVGDYVPAPVLPLAPVPDYAPTPVIPAAPVGGYIPAPEIPVGGYLPVPVVPAAPAGPLAVTFTSYITEAVYAFTVTFTNYLPADIQEVTVCPVFNEGYSTLNVPGYPQQQQAAGVAILPVAVPTHTVIQVETQPQIVIDSDHSFLKSGKGIFKSFVKSLKSLFKKKKEKKLLF